MDEKLNEFLTEYKALTIKIIEKLNKAEYDNEVDELFNGRQELINNINKLSYEGQAFRDIVGKLQLMEAENSLNELINTKKHEIQMHMADLKKGKNARNAYSKRFNVGAVYMSKKIE